MLIYELYTTELSVEHNEAGKLFHSRGPTTSNVLSLESYILWAFIR